MPKAKVHFLPVKDGESLESIARKTAKLCRAAFEGVVVAERPCAIKTHFGEGKNTNYVKPPIVRAVVEHVKKSKGKPFVTDTNTLYKGSRSMAADHILQAYAHGFTFDAINAPVVIADGLMGTDQVTVPIKGGKRFEAVRIAAAAHHAASSIVVTHVKGHCLAGFGGSIKNVGMGCAARAGKLAQHHNSFPIFNNVKCTGCGACVRWCPADAIELRAEKAALLQHKCIGCGECYALCPFGAIDFEWSESAPAFLEKMCEHVAGFLSNKSGHVGYLNFVMDMAKNCDCMGGKQPIEYPNLGILASTDIVAVDKAAADMTIAAYGKDIWSAWWPDSNYAVQFTYGEKMGIGSAEYEVVEEG